MPSRIPLYVRILGWFFLNVAVLAAGVWLALRPGRTGEWFVMQQAEPRLQPVARLLVQELQQHPQEQWSDILQKYDEAHAMSFAVFGPAGRQLAGVLLDPPPKVRGHLNPRPPDGQPFPTPGGAPAQPYRPQGRPFDEEGRRLLNQGLVNPPGGGTGRFSQNPPGPNPPLPGSPGGPGRAEPSFAKIVEHTDDPSAWWFIIRVPLRTGAGPGGASLVVRAESLAAGGLLGDIKPWLWGAAGLLVISALLWFPFVRSITRTVGGMKKATARIAGGEFDVALPDRRRDELGELAGGINRMAARLSGFVTGQKRFLGDIAHELCTPLARMQMAGAALEQRAPQELQPRIADLISEVEAMSQLVSELLDFSRAGLAPQSVALTDIPLLPLVEQVVARESVPADCLTLQVPAGFPVRGHPGLLARAIGNVVRNALRYSGPDVHLDITARDDGGQVLLTVSDNGPGVPEQALANLFDPFFRLESARDRASGGAGLGLAIVRTCVESCGGTVSARNRAGAGLEIQFRLPAGTSSVSGSA
jgi:two-component system sensor histidine kinase CpxA